MHAITDEKIEGEYDPNQRANSGRHLGAAGVKKLIEYITTGYTNRRINLLLVRDNILEPGDSLSHATFAHYRRLPEAKVDLAKLTDEAVTAGHAAVSRMVVGQVEIWDEVYEKLTCGNIDDVPAAKLAAYATLLKNASECILGLFAPNLSDRIREHIDALRDATKSAEEEKNYAKQSIFNVTQIATRYLKGELSREQAERAIGEFAVKPDEKDMEVIKR